MDERNTEQIESLASVFQALSDENRLRILELLRTTPHPICVNGIASNIGISQSAVSQHLKILKNTGLVGVKKEGYFKHYSLNLGRLGELRQLREEVLGSEFQI